MAFTNTPVSIVPMANGLVQESGTWNGDSVTTGTITAATTAPANDPSYAGPYIKEISQWGFASNGDTAVIPAKDVPENQIKITFTSSDTGNYYLIGKGR